LYYKFAAGSAAGSFHAKTPCSRLLIFYFLKSFFEPPFGDLGVTYRHHLYLIGKLMVDFPFV